MNMERQRQAAEWLLRLKEPDLQEEVISEWVTWCAADARNRSAFDAMCEAWQLSGQLNAERFAPARGRPHRRLWTFAAIAASVVVAFGVCIAMWQSASSGVTQAGSIARVQTERGNLQSVRLDDGSRMELGGRSAVSVRYTPQRRLIIAEAGEAFFKVRKDRARPFVVWAGPLTITAVGTAFAVEREGNSVAVAVTEGVVEVRPASGQSSSPAASQVTRLSAGQRIRFDRGELMQSIEPITPDLAAAWEEGRLEFKDEPLRLVIARINRYTPHEIEIGDPSIEDLHVTGTVYNDRIDAWLAGLEAVLPVRVERMDNRRIVLTAATDRG